MELDFDFFSIEPGEKHPKQGRILISEPFLRDPYFKRSIVFLTEHNNEGTIGFALNKPVQTPLNEVLEGFPDTDVKVSLGGPVGTNTVHYLHTMGDIIPKSVQVYKNIFWGGDFNAVKTLITTGKLDKTQIRFFIGYSGWKPGQLENEISENSWLITELEPGFIMRDPDENIWKEILQKLGKKYRMWADFPENPGMN